MVSVSRLIILGAFTLFSIAIHAAAEDAKFIHIIHTNDLHSYFDGHRDGRGGYHRLKTQIDELREAALNRTDLDPRGVETIVLDGGDFGEGTSFFLVDEGEASFRSLNELGIDAAVVGNHDFMLGVSKLITQIGNSRDGFDNHARILSANMAIVSDDRLEGYIDPFIDVEVGDASIRIIGLTTPEPHFQHFVLPNFVLPPDPAARVLSTQARDKEMDIVIALTHLGVNADRDLINSTDHVDLVVGGHSHTRLEEPIYQRNRQGRMVPIVQTGSHGLAVGSLFLKITEENKAEVVEYKLHDITVDIPKDPEVNEFVQEAIVKRDDYFNGRWNEVVGSTNIELAGYKYGERAEGNSCWGQHMARMSRESTQADVGLHLVNFQGMFIPVGDITYGDLVDNYPHFREYGENGWTMATFESSGKFLKSFIRIVSTFEGQIGFDFDGISWRSFRLPSFIPFIGDREFAYNFEVNGERVRNSDKYTVAFPVEIGLAAEALLRGRSDMVLPDFDRKDNLFFWDIMEDYVGRHSPIDCIQN